MYLAGLIADDEKMTGYVTIDMNGAACKVQTPLSISKWQRTKARQIISRTQITQNA